MKNISILDANINIFRNEMAKAARKYKDVAETMVFEQGLRGDVDNRFVRKILPDYFDKTGNLTESGKNGIKDIIFDMFSTPKSKKVAPEKVSIQKFFQEFYKPIKVNLKNIDFSFLDDFAKRINR